MKVKRVTKTVDALENIEAVSTEKQYEVEVNFAGYVGADERYFVWAENEEDAIIKAEEEAADDLSCEDWTEVDDGEWEVSVGFCGFIGVEESYTVYAESEEEACDAAIDEARMDLSGEVIGVDEDDDLEDEDEDEE